MKTLFNPSRVFALLAAGFGLSFAQPFQAQAADGKPVCVDKLDNFTYLVRVSNPTQQRSEMLLERPDGKRLYSSNDFAPSYGRKLNLKNLEDGQYAIVVKTGQEVYRYTLTVQTLKERVCLVNEAPVALK